MAGLAAFTACDDDGGSAAPTPTPPSATTTRAPTPTAEPAADLAMLIAPRADLPATDPLDLAQRYGLTDGRAPATKPFAGEPQVGDQREFFVQRITGAANGAAPVITTITAVLQAKSEHALFWVDASVPVPQAATDQAAEAFESTAWPRVTEVFGLPPTPGVDGDPRIVVLQSDLGGVGGYVSPDNLFPREVRPLSNEAELINMDISLAIGTGTFNAVLAHELQHLVHEANDFGEESWVNEGLSETAFGLVGGTPSTISSFEARPETQLNAWSFGSNQAHYGAGAAFFRYLAGRFGGDPALGAIARQGGDGPLGVDQFLAQVSAGVAFAGVFADWLAANVLNAPEGPYANPLGAVQARVSRTLVPGDTAENAVAQFGTDYYGMEGLAGGEYELRFTGEAVVDVLPPSAGETSGAFWWSNRGDEINTKLTREVDLSGATAPVLSFIQWHDIERWYDRGYVSVSTDGGATWTALPGETTVTDDPVRLAFGPGYQGTSGDPLEPAWVEERVDLAPYAGQAILLRFEYVTDGGTHGEGWAVRELRIEGLRDSPLPLDTGWDAEGWVLMTEKTLPQAWVVRLIGEDAAGAPRVLDVPLDATNAGTLRFNPDDIRNPVLAVAGATEGTHQPAAYRVELVRP